MCAAHAVTLVLHYVPTYMNIIAVVANNIHDTVDKGFICKRLRRVNVHSSEKPCSASSYRLQAAATHMCISVT